MRWTDNDGKWDLSDKIRTGGLRFQEMSGMFNKIRNHFDGLGIQNILPPITVSQSVLSGG